MLTRIFALMGFRWATHSKAQQDTESLRSTLVALSKPGVQLSNEAYRVADSYCTETQRAEFERDLLNLRNRHVAKRARTGLVRCAMVLADNDYAKIDPYLQQVAEEEGLYSYPRRNGRGKQTPVDPPEEGERIGA